MPRHSAFVAAVRSSVPNSKRNTTPNAILTAIVECYGGRLHRAPLTGGDRARRRKVAGSLNINIDDLANVIGDEDGRNAVVVLRAIAEQAAVDHRIVIRECVADHPVRPLADAEMDFTSIAARFVVAVDDARADRVVTSLERRRLRELEQAVASRAALVTRAMDFDGVDQS